MKQNRQVMEEKNKINSLGLISKTSGVVLHGFKCAFQMIPISDGYNSGLSRNQNLFTVSKMLGRGYPCTSSVLLFSMLASLDSEMDY